MGTRDDVEQLLTWDALVVRILRSLATSGPQKFAFEDPSPETLSLLTVTCDNLRRQVKDIKLTKPPDVFKRAHAHLAKVVEAAVGSYESLCRQLTFGLSLVESAMEREPDYEAARKMQKAERDVRLLAQLQDKEFSEFVKEVARVVRDHPSFSKPLTFPKIMEGIERTLY